jgi:hypothetical protein
VQFHEQHPVSLRSPCQDPIPTILPARESPRPRLRKFAGLWRSEVCVRQGCQFLNWVISGYMTVFWAQKVSLFMRQSVGLSVRRVYLFDPGLRVLFPMPLFCFSSNYQFILLPLILHRVWMLKNVFSMYNYPVVGECVI